MCLSMRALAPTSSCRSKAQRVCKIKSLGLSSDCRGQMHIVTGLNLQITGEHFVVKQNTIKAIYRFMMENDDPYVKFGVKMFVSVNGTEVLLQRAAWHMEASDGHIVSCHHGFMPQIYVPVEIKCAVWKLKSMQKVKVGGLRVGQMLKSVSS